MLSERDETAKILDDLWEKAYHRGYMDALADLRKNLHIPIQQENHESDPKIT